MGKKVEPALKMKALYSSPSIFVVLFSAVLVAYTPEWSKNIKWKIPEINKLYALNCMLFLNTVMKSHAIPFCFTQNINHPFVQHIHAVYSPHSVVSSHLGYQIDCWLLVLEEPL